MDPKINFALLVAACSIAAFMTGRNSIKPDVDFVSKSNNNAIVGKRASREIRQQSSNEMTGAMARSEQSTKSEPTGQNPSIDSNAKFARIQRLEIMKSQPDPLKRMELFLGLLKESDSKGISFLIYEMFPSIGRENSLMNNMATEVWASHYPEKARVEAINSIYGSEDRQSIMSYFASVDPQEAVRWAKANNVGGGTNVRSMLEYTLEAVAARHPQLATQLLSDMEEPRDYDLALKALSLHYADKGEKSARSWAEGIKNEKLRDGAIAHVAKNLAVTDPKSALDWLNANPGKNSGKAMIELMVDMAYVDSTIAISYLEKFKDPPAKQSALGRITWVIAKSDPKAALELINANPGLVSDDILEIFSRGARKSDPKLVGDTIARIGDPSVRKEAYTDLIESWSGNDPASANAWIESQNFPPEYGESLKNLIK